MTSILLGVSEQIQCPDCSSWNSDLRMETDTTQLCATKRMRACILLNTERLRKNGCLGKISCEQMPLQLFDLCCIDQLTGHEVHRFIAHLCHGCQ